MKKDKYIFDDLSLENECYHLASLFLASNNIKTILYKRPKSLFSAFLFSEPQEIKKLIISISIQLRMIDDLMKDYGRKNYIPLKKVGIVKYNSKNKSKKMSIRDACNKIIHAKSLIIISEKNKINLTGIDPNKADWSATLLIIDYIESALNLIKSYSEDWEISAYH